MKSKPYWMRVIGVLTLIIVIIALLSPFAAILLPRLLQPLSTSRQSEIAVSNAWVRPIDVPASSSDMEGMSMNDAVTAAYMAIENRGGVADTLISVSTDIATMVELHQTQIDASGIARMRPQPEGIEIPANSIVKIEPISYHIMLTGLTQSLERGESIVLNLSFTSGTTMDISAVIADFAPEQ